MTTLYPGVSLPSRSASSTMRFAILSLTDPPAEVYSTFPTARQIIRHLGSDRTWRIYSQRLHCRPSSFAIRSSLTRGVFPTAPSALSMICAACAMASLCVRAREWGEMVDGEERLGSPN